MVIYCLPALVFLNDDASIIPIIESHTDPAERKKTYVETAQDHFADLAFLAVQKHRKSLNLKVRKARQVSSNAADCVLWIIGSGNQQ
jgi:hypothetical protein